jgi:RNA polymerase sigma-70 factor (ECF subfamily)
MNTKLLAVFALSAAIRFIAEIPISAQELDSIPPVVVRTVPEAGANDVPAGEYVIKVTFSKPMMDRSWSWNDAWQGSTPQMIEQPRYEADGRTCVIKVKLEPGRTYGWWLNSQKFQGFRDAQNHPAVPYLLTFKAKSDSK